MTCNIAEESPVKFFLAKALYAFRIYEAIQVPPVESTCEMLESDMADCSCYLFRYAADAESSVGSVRTYVTIDASVKLPLQKKENTHKLEIIESL